VSRSVLETVLRGSHSLETVYSHKQRLQEIWKRSNLGQESLLHALQEWYRQAEATGIQVLIDVAFRLRGARVMDLIAWLFSPSDPRVPRSDRPRCGAKTRKGTPCQAPAVWDEQRHKPMNGRCKLHGGLSTGATFLSRRPSSSDLSRPLAAVTSFPGRRPLGFRQRPQSTLRRLGFGFEPVQAAVRCVFLVNPGVAAANQFGVHVTPINVDAANSAPITVAGLLAHGCDLS
jgi:hypothetical protein